MPTGPGIGRRRPVPWSQIDLPSIADAFAESVDKFPTMFTGRKDYRYLVTTGSLIPAAVVIGQLVADGSIVLFGIENR